jgi:cathepsin A (carboxypeptidase C)
MFLDQPVNVGCSYAENGNTVSASPVAGENVYAFQEPFLNRFPKYAHASFHIAAESYGGIYGPNIASVIFRENKAHSFTPIPGVKKINLASLILANGLTDPYIQMSSVVDYVCDGPFPLYDDPDRPHAGL